MYILNILALSLLTLSACAPGSEKDTGAVVVKFNDSGVADTACPNPTTYYADRDLDGYGDPTKSQENCNVPNGPWVDNSKDCDDTNAGINPDATDEVGDNIDQNCDGVDGLDHDGDGHASISTGGDDCNDQDPTAYPGNTEVCDGVDNDCNAQVDDVDMDGDGYTDMSCATATNATDCNDADPSINPSEPETNGNGVDDNCNGTVDGLHASLSWTPDETTVFTFQMVDFMHTGTLYLYTSSDEETDETGASGEPIALPAGWTSLEGEYTGITYAFVATGYLVSSEYPSTSANTQCFVWGPNATEVLGWMTTSDRPCNETDPTTW